MLSLIYAKRQCVTFKLIMLSVVMLSVIMLSVVVTTLHHACLSGHACIAMDGV
jgi:hypothetical protein